MSVKSRSFSGLQKLAVTQHVQQVVIPTVSQPAPKSEPAKAEKRAEQIKTEFAKIWKAAELSGGVGGYPSKGEDVGPEDEDSWQFRVTPYYRTLAQPSVYTGIRIPDNCSYSTVTFSMVKRVTFTSPASGACGIIVGQGIRSGALQSCLIPNLTTATIGTAPTSNVLGYTSGTGALTTQIFGTGATAADANQIVFDDWSSATSRLPLLVGQARVVSAGVSVRFIGTYSSSAGVMTGAFMPRNFAYSNPTTYDLTTLSTTTLAQIPGSVQTPVVPGVEGNSGITVTYQPVDDACNTFVDLDVDASTLSSYESSLYNPGAMVVGVEGASNGAKFQACIWINYEGIPRANSLIFQNALGSAVDDPIALSAAFNRSRDFGGARPGTIGFDGLHTSGFVARSTTSHPMAQRIFGMRSNMDEAEGWLVHDRPRNFGTCECGAGGEDVDANTEAVEQGEESSFQALLGQLGDAVVKAAPGLIGKLAGKLA